LGGTVLASNKKLTRHLSQPERERGLKNYLRQSFWNGLGFNFLGTTIVFLMAIHFGATNLQLGYISSVFHVVGVVNLFVPHLFRGVNVTRVFFYSWLARGLICLGYVLLIFLEGQAAVFCILAVYTLFALLRIPGMAVEQTVQKNLFKESEAGSAIVRLNIRNSIAQLISQITSFILLSIQLFSSIGGLVLLTLFGTVSNTISASYLRKIPSREKVDRRKGRNLIRVFVDSMRHREIAFVQLTRWFGLSAVILLSLTVPFLRREVGLQQNMVFLYTIVGAVAAILAGYVIRPFVDRIGGKPLLTLANLILALLAVLWTLSSPNLPRFVYYIYGFLTFFFLRTRLMLTSKLMIQVIPERDRVIYTSITNFVTAAIAFLVGFAGGTLLDFGESLAVPFFHAFSLVFLLSAVLAASSSLFCINLKDPGSLSIREASLIFLSTRNLRAFLDSYQMGTTDDPVRKQITLLSLEQSDTPIATSHMADLLKSPLSWEKERILRSLFSYPRKDLIDEIIDEAKDKTSYNRLDAIFTLGAYPGARVRRVLEGFLEEEDSAVVATALKSLARIGDTKHLAKVKDLLHDASQSPRTKLDCVTALSRMDRSASYLKEMFKMAGASQGPRYKQMVFIICGRRFGLTPPLSDIYRSENIESVSGFADLVTEAKELPPFFDSGARLIEQFREGDYAQIWRWCRNEIKDRKADKMLRFLSTAIREHDLRDVNSTNTLAAIYFTYQILVA
jgi:hypothetical protein